MKHLSTSKVLLAAFLLCSGVQAAPGDVGTKFQVNDTDPSANIPTDEDKNAYPIEFGYWLQDMGVRAETAFTEQRWADAAKYYSALATAVPDVALPFSRLCASYEHLGNTAGAITQCEKALGLAGAKLLDHTRFMRLTLEQTTLSDEAAAAVAASVDHVRNHLKTAGSTADADQAKVVQSLKARLRKTAPAASAAPAQATLAAGTAAENNEPPIALQVELFSCKLGLRTGDVQRLNDCTLNLKQLQVDEQAIVPFQWALASALKDTAGVQAALARARQLGLPEQAISLMSAPPAAPSPVNSAANSDGVALPASAGSAASTPAPTLKASSPLRSLGIAFGGLALLAALSAGAWARLKKSPKPNAAAE